MFLPQSWTERAKGQSGDDLKKRKRPEEAAEGDDEDSRGKADENTAKKKKSSLDSTAKLSAFAFNKN